MSAAPQPGAVTPRGVRDGHPEVLAALCGLRGSAVLAFVEAVCEEPLRVRAAADAFARFRVLVARPEGPPPGHPDAVLLGCAVRAALELAPRGPDLACAAVPPLLAQRMDGTLDEAGESRVERHAGRCAACRGLAAALEAGRAAYRAAPVEGVPGEATAAIVAAMAAAAPVRLPAQPVVPSAGEAASRAPAGRNGAAAAPPDPLPEPDVAAATAEEPAPSGAVNAPAATPAHEPAAPAEMPGVPGDAEIFSVPLTEEAEALEGTPAFGYALEPYPQGHVEETGAAYPHPPGEDELPRTPMPFPSRPASPRAGRSRGVPSRAVAGSLGAVGRAARSGLARTRGRPQPVPRPPGAAPESSVRRGFPGAAVTGAGPPADDAGAGRHLPRRERAGAGEQRRDEGVRLILVPAGLVVVAALVILAVAGVFGGSEPSPPTGTQAALAPALAEPLQSATAVSLTEAEELQRATRRRAARVAGVRRPGSADAPPSGDTPQGRGTAQGAPAGDTVPANGPASVPEAQDTGADAAMP